MNLPNFMLYPLLGLAWLILLGAPVAGFFTARRLRQKPDLVMALLLFTALVPAFILAGVSTASQTVNLAVCFAAYAGYSLLAALIPISPLGRLRIPTTLLAYLPIALGYAAATICALALLFLLGESYPLSRQPMRPGLMCEISAWGIPGGTKAGYAVNLYRTPLALPLVRRLAYSVSITVAPGAAGPWPGCADILQQYDHSRPGFAAAAPAAKLNP